MFARDMPVHNLSREQIHDGSQEVNKNSSEALQTALDGVNRRIDNLMALKISPENDGSLLSDTEFADRKRELMMEKEHVTRQLSQAITNGKDWTDIAKDAFEFALLANKRFENGDSEDKKVSFQCNRLEPDFTRSKIELSA